MNKPRVYNHIENREIKSIRDDQVNIHVLVNGKYKFNIDVEKDLSDDEVEMFLMEEGTLGEIAHNGLYKDYEEMIIIPNKLVNVILTIKN
jgi:leucyl-tRNA synthetase